MEEQVPPPHQSAQAASSCPELESVVTELRNTSRVFTFVTTAQERLFCDSSLLSSDT